MSRSFGLELEFCDAAKNSIVLPAGYKWSPDEMWIINSDMSPATPAAKKGGEINTRPLFFVASDLVELENFIAHLFENGAVINWYQTFDIHVGIEDLTLEQRKNLVYMNWKLNPIMNEFFGLTNYTKEEAWSPPLTADEMNRVDRAQNEDQLKECFANSSIKGCRRHNININPFWRIGTVEFRSFAGTSDFAKVKQSIEMCLAMVDLALKGRDAIDEATISIEAIRKATGCKLPVATYPPVLIWAENHKVQTTYRAKAFMPNAEMRTSMAIATGKDVQIINDDKFGLAAALVDTKNVTVVNNSEYNHILRELALGEVELEYKDHFTILNEYKNGTAVREVAMFLIFERIHKYNIEEDYGSLEFMNYVDNIEASIEKMRTGILTLIKQLDEIKYEVGILTDAIATGGDIIYLQEKQSKRNSTVGKVKKFTDYDGTFKTKSMSYSGIENKLENATLFVLSENEYLSMNKIAKAGNAILYCSKDRYAGVNLKHKPEVEFNVNPPPDNWRMNPGTKVTIAKITPTQFFCLQRTYVKKVAKLSPPLYCFVVNVDDYTLGAFGFDRGKTEEYALFLRSDFTTNNNVPLLSKFIIMLTKAKIVKKTMERLMSEIAKNAYTMVYTVKPTSMKYRGVYRKVSRENNKIIYDFELGSAGEMSEVINDYVKRVGKR